MSGPAASVVIRTLDEAGALGPVLDAVLTQDEVGPIEVIVIDSGSRDGTLAVARRFPVAIHELPPGTFTFGGALNLGARLARAPIAVHLSAHCAPTDRRWLGRLLAPLAEPDVVAAYGRQVPVPGVNPYEEIELERIFTARPLDNGARQYFSNANCAIRRTALLARPFDETITIMEDALWLMDLGPGERVVYVPEAVVTHSHPLRLRYWYRRYWRDGMAYRYIKARRRIDVLPERSLRPAGRLLALAAELAVVTRALIARGYWRHLAAYPLFCCMREVALRRGMRRGAALYAEGDAGRSP